MVWYIYNKHSGCTIVGPSLTILNPDIDFKPDIVFDCK